jgi:hypothetical protein
LKTREKRARTSRLKFQRFAQRDKEAICIWDDTIGHSFLETQSPARLTATNISTLKALASLAIFTTSKKIMAKAIGNCSDDD